MKCPVLHGWVCPPTAGDVAQQEKEHSSSSTPCEYSSMRSSSPRELHDACRIQIATSLARREISRVDFLLGGVAMVLPSPGEVAYANVCLFSGRLEGGLPATHLWIQSVVFVVGLQRLRS